MQQISIFSECHLQIMGNSEWRFTQSHCDLIHNHTFLDTYYSHLDFYINKK